MSDYNFKKFVIEKNEPMYCKGRYVSPRSKGRAMAYSKVECEVRGNSPEYKSMIPKDVYVQHYCFPFCPEISKYTNLEKIGEGTYGVVFKGIDKDSNRQVAIKQVITKHEEGFPMTSMREIKILQLLKHENIIKLLEVCKSSPVATKKFKSEFYLIMEYCDHDLQELLSNSDLGFKLCEKKMCMKQLLDGLFYIHQNKVIHRDLKPPNIFITIEGILKIGDFGLARSFSIKKSSHRSQNRMTIKVVTRWYRAPEIILGDRHYGPAIDIWSIGCIMAEFWSRYAIFQGPSDPLQLSTILSLCGPITKHVWPNAEQLPHFSESEFFTGRERKIREVAYSFKMEPEAVDLLERLLTLDPQKRIDADGALDHPFFWTDPMPSSLRDLVSKHAEIIQKRNSEADWRNELFTCSNSEYHPMDLEVADELQDLSVFHSANQPIQPLTYPQISTLTNESAQLVIPSAPHQLASQQLPQLINETAFQLVDPLFFQLTNQVANQHSNHSFTEHSNQRRREMFE